MTYCVTYVEPKVFLGNVRACIFPEYNLFRRQTMTTTTAAPTRIYIATPAYGCLLGMGYVSSILNLQLECARRGIHLVFDIIGNESLVQRARCILTERFFQSEASTHLLFIDADIGFSPEAVIRLLEADKDIVSAVYPKKTFGWDQVARKLNAGETKEPLHQMGLDFNINLKQGSASIQPNGLVNVLDTATGFLMIKRRVIEKMKEHYKESLFAVNDIQSINNVSNYVALFDCMIDPDTRRYLSEDYAFCRRWQQMDPQNNDIWVDIRTPLSHTGNHFFEGKLIL